MSITAIEKELKQVKKDIQKIDSKKEPLLSKRDQLLDKLDLLVKDKVSKLPTGIYQDKRFGELINMAGYSCCQVRVQYQNQNGSFEGSVKCIDNYDFLTNYKKV